MKHYNEVELLESYYLGGASPEIVSHVDACTDCSERYVRLREKLACSAQTHQKHVESKPQVFWARQQALITASLKPRRQQVPVWRYAAAAVLTLLLAVAVVTNLPDDAPTPPVASNQNPVQIDAEPELASVELAGDPWEADALEPYAEVVEWEAWLSDEKEGS